MERAAVPGIVLLHVLFYYEIFKRPTPMTAAKCVALLLSSLAVPKNDDVGIPRPPLTAKRFHLPFEGIFSWWQK